MYSHCVIGSVHIAHIRYHGHGFDGQIEIGRRAGEAIAIEALGSDAQDGDGLGIDPECAADDGRFAAIIVPLARRSIMEARKTL